MKKQVLLFGLLLMAFGSSNAQLLNKISKAKNQASDASEVVEKGKEVTKGGKKKKGGEPAALKLDWNIFKQTPAITFNSLLYGTGSSTGRIDNYTATFIPHKTADGKEVHAFADQSGYLKIKIYKDNQYMNYFEYSGDQVFDDGKKTKLNWPSSRYQRDGEWVGWSESFITDWGVGNYRLDFYAGDKMFYSFDFELAKIVSDDPYAKTNEIFVTRGPWSNYAFMQHAESGNLIFGFYLNHEILQPNPSNANKTNISVDWTLKMFKDGKPFAKQYDPNKNVAIVERADWKEFNCALRPIDKPNGEAIKFSDLKDGNYKIEVTLSNEKKPRVYNFTVQNNKIVPIEEQDRTKMKDPTRLIEGWNDFIWLKLVK